MEDRPRDERALRIREGSPTDHEFVVALGTEAFARFGDYGPIMEAFLASPDVVSMIAEEGGVPIGFALVDLPPALPAFADLVAIAVAPDRRGAGIGRALLAHVIAERAARGVPSLIVLTVADDNRPAIRLFRSAGFEAVPGSEGRYAAGQTSRRMARAVMP
jgi:ribosomal protein S18 acetylase RimI-like enzyme